MLNRTSHLPLHCLLPAKIGEYEPLGSLGKIVKHYAQLLVMRFRISGRLSPSRAAIESLPDGVNDVIRTP